MDFCPFHNFAICLFHMEDINIFYIRAIRNISYMLFAVFEHLIINCK